MTTFVKNKYLQVLADRYSMPDLLDEKVYFEHTVGPMDPLFYSGVVLFYCN